MTLSRTTAIIAAVALVLATTAVAGKKDQDRIAELEARVAALEKALAEMETSVDRKLDEAIQDIAMRDQRADEALRSILSLANAGKQIEAKAQMEEFNKKYAGTEAARRAQSLDRELAVVGKPAPAQFNVEKWFQGDNPSVDLADGGTSLLVFWEEWCPHCKREVPRLKATYDKYREQGLRIVGLTRITRSATEEKVEKFIETHQLPFPIAKESGSLSNYFNVSGIPAAAVVKDGKVVWRGHPNRLTDALLESWL